MKKAILVLCILGVFVGSAVAGVVTTETVIVTCDTCKETVEGVYYILDEKQTKSNTLISWDTSVTWSNDEDDEDDVDIFCDKCLDNLKTVYKYNKIGKK